ncbi:MAG: lipoprotein [Candidatus Omnitrophica bacterium]|nr:lipoprotein [Candidatus Omnitrophota bacterium]
MKKSIFIILAALLVSGCVPVLIGAGLLTGYTLSSDSAIGNVKTEYRELWDICLEKLEVLESEVLVSDESQGLLKARISDYDVNIKIKNISNDTQRLKVSARKLLLPKPQFAQKIFFKIIEDL